MSDFVLIHELGEDADNARAAGHGGISDCAHEASAPAAVHKRPLARGEGGAEIGGELHELGGVAGRRTAEDADAEAAC